MSTSPAISVLMPTRNGSRYVAEAIRSILAQDFDDFELLISDDGSTDDTLSIIESFSDPRLSVICQNPRPGLFANHNHLLRHSKGQWIKYLHQDDVLLPGALRTYADLTRCPVPPAFIAARTNLIDENGVNMGAFPWCFGEDRVWGAGELTNLSLRLGNIIGNPPSVFFRRSVLQDAPFNEDLKNSADWDVLLRLSSTHSVQSTAHVLVAYRVHSAAQSAINQGNQTTAFEDLAILRKLSSPSSEASAGAMAGMWRQHLQIMTACLHFIRSGSPQQAAHLASRLLDEDPFIDLYEGTSMRNDLLRLISSPDECPLFRSSLYSILWHHQVPLSLDTFRLIRSRRHLKLTVIGYQSWTYLLQSLCLVNDASIAWVQDIYGNIALPKLFGAPVSKEWLAIDTDAVVIVGASRIDDFSIYRSLSNSLADKPVLRLRDWVL